MANPLTLLSPPPSLNPTLSQPHTTHLARCQRGRAFDDLTMAYGSAESGVEDDLVVLYTILGNVNGGLSSLARAFAHHVRVTLASYIDSRAEEVRFRFFFFF